MNNTEQGANNYSTYNYFSKQVTEITVKTSIDLIKLSNITHTSFKEIDYEIKNYGYKVKRDCYLREGKYKRKREYLKDKSEIDFIYDHKANNYERTIPDILFVHDPTKEVMEGINKILSNLYITPKLMKMELPWDFYVKGIPADEFKELIEKHLLLKRSRTKSFRVKTTYYPSNTRKSSSKGMRVYPDKETGGYPIRVELELHRGKIRGLNIPFPVTNKSLRIDFTKMFCFKKIDLEGLMNYELKKSRHDMAMADIRRPKMGQLVLRMIEAYIDHIKSDSLMESIEKLKDKDHGVDGYARFLIPMEKENRLIQEVADRMGFLDEGYRADME